MRQRKIVIEGLRLSICGLVLLVAATPSYARFHESDANEVDREERLGTEYYNDEISYRPPFHWRRLWREHNLGLRVNAGSYNANRFMYEEDIKLISPTDRPVTFALLQERKQDLLTDINEREMRVQLNVLRPFLLSILADSDSFKSNADLGTALGLDLTNHIFLETYFWSVNHLYNQKRYHTTNEVLKPTRTFGIKGLVMLPADLQINIKAEVDTPLVWDRVDENHEYRYERRFYLLGIGHGIENKGWWQEIILKREYKKEAQFWNLTTDETLDKKMQREFTEVEGRLNYTGDSGYDITQGVIWMERDVDYDWNVNVIDSELFDPPDEKSPDVMRSELNYYLTFFDHIPNTTTSAYQLGLFLTGVRIRENEQIDRKNEVKFQLAWIYEFTPTVQSFFNATFNLDGVYENYPYKDEPFKPWDGGALQIVALF